jgi:hypothetical protein
VEEFTNYGIENNFTSIFLWMPQKDDLLYIRKHGNYYNKFIEKVKKEIKIIDLTDTLINCTNLDSLYCDDSHYGGHFSIEGNKLIAEIIYKELNGK